METRRPYSRFYSNLEKRRQKMQIDFHHAVTYVAARLAGFDHGDADIVAYAAQYVDDATSDGAIKFDNGAMYQRISSAHKAIDPDNLDPLEDLLVWMPFHFLPGNGGARAGKNPRGSFIRKIVAKPGSPVAREMVKAAIADQNKPYSLHRLGITMHVYADTWAHQGFAGVIHDINEMDDFDEIGTHVFEGGLKEIKSRFVAAVAPALGHGKAYIFPDMPFLHWTYKNGLGEKVERNNTEYFCKAADALCKAMQEYRKKTDSKVKVTGIGEEDMKKIRSLFTRLKNKDGDDRHKSWLRAIKRKTFSFGAATVSYAEDGPDSWKHQALGTSRSLAEYPYKDSFLQCNWKLFHDALQVHRLTVTRDILPKYGICAA
jgi:hypothetical protein